jgi:hypothetical protein
MSGDSDATSSQPKDLRNSKKDPDLNFIAPNLQKTNSWVTRSKFLSPEFNNIEDEAELGKLMGTMERSCSPLSMIYAKLTLSGVRSFIFLRYYLRLSSFIPSLT